MRVARPLRVLAAALVPVSAPALAQGQDVLTLEQLLRVTGSLLLVVGLAYLAAWLLRRFGGARLQPSARLRVLASTPVGQRERVALVQVDDERLVLGVAPGRITLLGSLGAEAAAAPAPGAAPAEWKR